MILPTLVLPGLTITTLDVLTLGVPINKNAHASITAALELASFSDSAQRKTILFQGILTGGEGSVQLTSL